MPPIEDRRKGKLHHFFTEVLQGRDDIQTATKAHRFLEAICSETDPVACIQGLLAAKNGVLAIKQSLRIDVTPSFVNTSVCTFLSYLRNPELEVACGGDLLRDLLRHMVEPPVFWNFLCNFVETEILDPVTLDCFAWMLLRLLSDPTHDTTNYVSIASKDKIQHTLLNANKPETRNLYYKIQKTLRSLATSAPDEVNGPGGRHDNDFVDFRKIAVLPSIDELVCTDPPYLRFACDVEAASDADRMAVHLDNQFRLLREDMIRDMKEELQSQAKRKVHKIEGLRLAGIDFDPRNLWALEFRCTKGLHFMPKHKNSSQRQEFLKKHRKILSHGALVCLFVINAFIGFGMVWRREDKLSEDNPLLHIHLPSNETVIRRILKGVRDGSEIQVLPLHTAVFSYEPILKQLQNVRSLPLVEHIVGWMPTQTTPRVEVTKSLRQIIDKLQHDHSTELEQLLSLSKPVKLDPSQALCLTTGLSQQIALIQGPPGTGKSFIGSLIAKALHLHTKHTILVLSYTNHALDQYLEDLINIGIPAKDIVRLGSYSKASDATKSLLLMEKAKTLGYALKRNDWTLIDSYNELANDIGERLKSAFTEYTATTVARQEIMDYLEFSNDFEDYFEAFQIPPDHNFTTIGKKGKAIGPFYLLECWMKNNKVSKAIIDTSRHPHVWASTLDERITIRRRWLDDILEERLQRLTEYGQQYNHRIQATSNVRGENGRRLLRDIRIIGCTTTAAAKMVSEIQSVQPEIVIVEEAGEILESHILAALGPETKQLVLIGDHKQLRPKAHYDLSVEKGTGYDLNRSLFERLVLKDYPHQKLAQQHRMRPEISAMVRALTYPELTDAPGTRDRPPLRGIQNNIVFFDHTVPEIQSGHVYDPREGGTSSSKTNNFEAQVTLKCVKYMAQQGYRSDQIVVLTPYLGQLRLLFDVLKTENDPVLNDMDSHDLVRAGLMPAATAKASRTQLRVSTIDNYQGEESDIVIVSLTRSNNGGDIGFMSSPERLNVLISRARDGIIFIGNTQTFLNARRGKELWSKFLGMLRDKHHIYDGLPVYCQRHPNRKACVAAIDDFDKVCPDGGCDVPCGVKLNCGIHSCPSKCHQIVDHTKMQCASILTDTCSDGHKLSWKCSKKRPATCSTCDAKKRRDEVQKLKEHERLVNEDLRKQNHDATIAAINAEIELEQQRIRDMSLRDERQLAVEQKKADLRNARENVERARQGPKVPSMKHNTSGESKTSTTAPDKANAARKADSSGSAQVSMSSQATEMWESTKRVEGASNNAIDNLMQMTGLESVKQWTLEVFQKLQTVQRQGIDQKQERLGTVLLGNPGTGKTTVARHLANFFEEVKVISCAKFVETTGAKMANEGVAGAKKMLDDFLQAGGGVVFVDEAYQLVSGNSYGGGAVLDFLLAEIENTVGKIIFMFAGYEKQMEKFFQHNPGLASRMPHQLRFADYSEEELLHMLGRKVEKRWSGRMQVEDGLSGLYMRIAIRRLHRLSGQEGFGNARAVENLLAKIMSAQSLRVSRERLAGLKPDDLQLFKEDIIGVEPSGALASSKSWNKLQGMIGLESVKSSITVLLDRLVANYKRELAEQPILEVSLNRLFLGSPGTGKTTVAKLYGQILAEIGLLSSSECVVKTPADFIGSVLGESEKNTKAILDSTRGKVLVIDEAYMLSSTSKTGDMYRTAVVDTIVSEVHSVPGEDRAVLLLGYEEQMKEMLRKVNPGLARRFPVESAFYFEDYNDEQLLAVLNYKLTNQGLDATAEAKRTAIDLLGKLRRRPNFGNAGEVENLLSRAKHNYYARPKDPEDDSNDKLVFQPKDFDPDSSRGNNAVSDCRALFSDVVGSEDLVQKLTGYIQSFIHAREIDMNPTDILPFNFVFKGPPGTGKTTTARKIGTVFYNMGFLGSDQVVECSATDLVGEYVGQTGPKVVSKFDEALGQVLFMDEAYRLGEGPYAKEAVDEVVDCLTKDKYKGKMLVILAGYEEEINSLLKVNPGLSSRFPEEVMFAHLTPTLCVDLLLKKLQKSAKLVLELDKTSDQRTMAANLFKQLSGLSGWANGRDIETIASRVVAAVLKSPKGTDGVLRVTWSNVIAELERMYTEREKRAATTSIPLFTDQLQSMPQRKQCSMPPNDPPQMATVASTSLSAPPVNPPELVEETQPALEEAEGRDPGVSDAVWQQLQADCDRNRMEQAAREEAVKEAEAQQAWLARQASEAAARAKALEHEAAVNEEARRKLEEARLKAIAAKRKADEEALRVKKLWEEKQKALQQEQKAQQKLRQMGVCPAGFRWVRQSNGYRCSGGSHFVDNGQLGI